MGAPSLICSIKSESREKDADVFCFTFQVFYKEKSKSCMYWGKW